MKLLNIKAKNIFSLGEIDLPLDNRGLTLITGYSYDEQNPNGAGKSSLANKALVWGLYGKTAGGSSADSVINRHRSKEKAYAIVDVIGKDGKPYRIERSRNPTNLSLIQLLPNDNWKDLSFKQSKDTQEVINLILGRDFQTFIQSDFFGQGRKDSLFELSPSEQKQIIENILPLDELPRWIKNTKEAAKKINEKVKLSKEEVIKLDSRLKTLSQQREHISHHNNSWESRKAQEISSLLKQKSELSKTQPPKNLANLYRELEESQEIYSKKQNERGNLIKLRFDKVCPTCNREMPKEDLLEAEKNKERLRKLDEQMAVWSSNIKSISDYIKLTNLEGEIKEKEKEENPFATALDHLDKEYEATGGALHNAREALKLLQEDQEAVSIWDRAFSHDIRSLMLDDACPFLEDKTNAYLKDLGNPQIKVKFSTSKELKSGEKRNEFNISVASETGGETFDLLSGGEQQLCGFSVGLGLAALANTQVEGPSNILILDEPFMALSQRNSENIVNFLTEKLSKNKSTVLLISNEPTLKEMIPNRIHIVKDKGISRMES